MLLTAEQILICTLFSGSKICWQCLFFFYIYLGHFLVYCIYEGKNISFPLQIFPNIWQRNKRNKHIKIYNLGVVFLMETVKLQGHTSVLEFATEVWPWLPTATIILLDYISMFHMDSPGNFACMEKQRKFSYEETRHLTIEMVKQAATKQELFFFWILLYNIHHICSGWPDLITSILHNFTQFYTISPNLH